MLTQGFSSTQRSVDGARARAFLRRGGQHAGNVHLQPNMGIPGIPRSTGHVLRYDRCKASLVVDKRQRPVPVRDAGCLIYTEYVEGSREGGPRWTITNRNLSAPAVLWSFCGSLATRHTGPRNFRDESQTVFEPVGIFCPLRSIITRVFLSRVSSVDRVERPPTVEERQFLITLCRLERFVKHTHTHRHSYS